MSPWTRRQAIRVGALGALGATQIMIPAHAAQAGAAPKGSFDPADPVENLRAMARINGSLDGKPVYWWMEGHAYGLPAGQMRAPLCGVVGCRMVTYEPRGKAFQITTRDWGIFTSFDREPLAEFINPYTGQKLNPKPILTKKYSWLIDPERGQIVESTEAGTISSLTDRPFLMPWRIEGDRAWGKLETFVKYPAGAVGSEILAFTARSADLFSEGTEFVPAEVTWINESPWFGWLNMRGTPGGVMMVSAGRKERAARELPAFIQQVTERVFPGLLEDPANWKRPA